MTAIDSATSLPQTGERYLPEVSGATELEHLHRYLLARQIIGGKRVLDLACGEGYGSFSMSSVALSVVGVDISPETVLHAQSKYQRDNLRFLEGSCEAIPVADDSIDIVVSFETIEHHPHHE
jgi:ubiquinone/menaquinone biosynthesis C-methylase UbiE